MILFRMLKSMIPIRKNKETEETEETEEHAPKRISAFSKILLAAFFLIVVASIATSFILAAHDKDPVYEVTTAVLHVFGVHVVAYSGKTAWERYGRSKYKIDEDGVPFNLPESEDLEDEN